MKKYLFGMMLLLVLGCSNKVCAQNSISSVVKDTLPDELKEEKGEAPPGYQTNDSSVVEDAQSELCVYADALSGTTNITYSLVDGVLTISGNGDMQNYAYSSLPEWYASASTIKEVVIESGVTRIGKYAFYGLTSLEKVTFSDTVTTIGEAAFYGCTALTSISLPDTVKTLEDAAFAECKKLESIKMSGVTNIGTYAFQACAIKNFEIPVGVTKLGDYIFYDGKVESITVAPGNAVYSATDGVLYCDGGATLCLYPMGKTDSEFTIPDSVNKVAVGAFLGAAYLKKINLNKVNTLGSSAFQGCGLETLTIPDSVTEIGYFTFYECKQLKSVTFGNGFEVTSYQMFRGCSSLTDITFGTTLKELDAHTFAHCYSLENVELPSNITKIGNATFGGCTKLKSFKSHGLTDGIPYQAFWACSNLESVTLNEGIKTLYRCCFYYCSSLKTITVPESVTYIHEMAFPKTTEITCKNTDMKPFGYNGYCLGDYVSITGENKYSNAYEVLKLINEERSKAGVNPLVMEETLLDAAMLRAAEGILCFSHTRPDSSTCMSVSDKMYAENIAIGQTTAAEVVQSWMNSSGHKQNILNGDYTTIGIGCYYHNGVYSWVQCFGVASNASSKAQPSDSKQTYKILLASEEFDEATTGTGVIFDFGGNSGPYKYEFVLNVENDCIGKKESTQLHVAVKNASFSSYAMLDMTGLKFVSDNKKVATVSDKGVVTGVGKGKATITLKLTGFRAETKVGVETQVENPDSIIEIDKTIVQLVAGKGTLITTSKYVEKGEKYGYLPSPKRKGYKFNGWYTKAQKGKKVTKNTIVSTEKDHKLYAQWTKITVQKTTIKSATINKTKKLKITTKNTSGASGYQYMIATNSKFNKNVKKAYSKKTSYTFSNIKKNQKYYVRVRAYKIDSAGEKVYGKWSGVRKVNPK